MFASICEHNPHAQNIIPHEKTLGTFWNSMAAHPQMVAGAYRMAYTVTMCRLQDLENLGLKNDSILIFFRCWRWVAARKTKCYGCTASSRSFARVLGKGAHCAPSFRCWLGRSYGSSVGCDPIGTGEGECCSALQNRTWFIRPLVPILYNTHNVYTHCVYTLCYATCTV